MVMFDQFSSKRLPLAPVSPYIEFVAPEDPIIHPDRVSFSCLRMRNAIIVTYEVLAIVVNWFITYDYITPLIVTRAT